MNILYTTVSYLVTANAATSSFSGGYSCRPNPYYNRVNVLGINFTGVVTRAGTQLENCSVNFNVSGGDAGASGMFEALVSAPLSSAGAESRVITARCLSGTSHYIHLTDPIVLNMGTALNLNAGVAAANTYAAFAIGDILSVEFGLFYYPETFAYKKLRG